MSTNSLREGIQHVQIALRDPEEFAVRWHSGQAQYPWWVWASLFGTAMLGTLCYGLTMGLLGGPEQMLRKALLCTFCAGIAWLFQSQSSLQQFVLPGVYRRQCQKGNQVSEYLVHQRILHSCLHHSVVPYESLQTQNAFAVLIAKGHV